MACVLKCMKHYRQNQNQPVDIKELPSKQRPRERIQSHGALSLSDIDLITVLVGSGTRKNSVSVLATHILAILDRTPGRCSAEGGGTDGNRRTRQGKGYPDLCCA